MVKKRTQEKQKAIITVIGKDKVGIIASVTTILASNEINILDLSSTVMDDNFTMVMLVDLEKSDLNIAQLSDKLTKLGRSISQEIHTHDEKIIRAMHRI